MSPGVPHFLAILQYFGLQLFSHYWALSVALSFFCVLGLISLLRERRLFSYLAAGFVLIYLVFFSLQAAMLVRNLLVVVPILCLAVARGVTLTAERLHSGRKYLLYVSVGAVLIVNLGWEVRAASEIRKRETPEYFLKKFADYLNDSPKDTFLVSEELSKALDAFRAPAPGNVVTNPEAPHTKVAFFQSEEPIFFWETWPSNRGAFTRKFLHLWRSTSKHLRSLETRESSMTTKNFKTLPIDEWDLAGPIVPEQGGGCRGHRLLHSGDQEPARFGGHYSLFRRRGGSRGFCDESRLQGRSHVRCGQVHQERPISDTRLPTGGRVHLALRSSNDRRKAGTYFTLTTASVSVQTGLPSWLIAVMW